MIFKPRNITGQFCEECNGYTHIPFCSRYIDPGTARNILADIDRQGVVERAVDATNQEIVANGGYLSPQTLKEIAADEESLRRSFYVNAATIRMALADVIDEGIAANDKGSARKAWLFWFDESEEQTAHRAAFIDAAITRIQQLLDNRMATRLEDYCPKHKNLRLPLTTVGECVDCRREREGRG